MIGVVEPLFAVLRRTAIRSVADCLRTYISHAANKLLLDYDHRFRELGRILAMRAIAVVVTIIQVKQICTYLLPQLVSGYV